MADAATPRVDMRFWSRDQWRQYNDQLQRARVKAGRHMDSVHDRCWRALNIIDDISERLGRKDCPPGFASRRYNLRLWVLRELTGGHLYGLSMGWRVAIDYRRKAARTEKQLTNYGMPWARKGGKRA